MASLNTASRKSEDSGRRFFRAVMITIWALPPLHVLVTLFIGLYAYSRFGNWPRALNSLDALGFLGDIFSIAWGLTLIAFASSVVSGIIGTPVYFWRRGAGWAVGATIAYLVVWCLAFLYVRFDPHNVGNWLMD